VTDVETAGALEKSIRIIFENIIGLIIDIDTFRESFGKQNIEKKKRNVSPHIYKKNKRTETYKQDE